MSVEELKACPFCGGIDIEVDLDIQAATCNDCGCAGPSLIEEDEDDDEDAEDDDEVLIAEAMALWNKRV